MSNPYSTPPLTSTQKAIRAAVAATNNIMMLNQRDINRWFIRDVVDDPQMLFLQHLACQEKPEVLDMNINNWFKQRSRL
jgi:hypothetical protein